MTILKSMYSWEKSQEIYDELVRRFERIKGTDKESIGKIKFEKWLYSEDGLRLNNIHWNDLKLMILGILDTYDMRLNL